MFDVFLSPSFIELMLVFSFTTAATTVIGFLFLSIQTSKYAYALYVRELETEFFLERSNEEESSDHVPCLAYKIRIYLFASFFLSLLTFILHFPAFKTLSNILSSKTSPLICLFTVLLGLLAGNFLLLNFKHTVDRAYDSAQSSIFKAQKKNHTG